MAVSHTSPAQPHVGVPQARPARDVRFVENIGDGILGGGIGAGLVGLTFLIVDFVSREPLWTPSFVGSALFEGTTAANVVIATDAVAMYSFVHALAFVTVGAIAAALVRTAHRPVSFGLAAAVLFGVLQLGLFAVDIAIEPALLRGLGVPEALFANALAALGMAGYLTNFLPRRSSHSA